MGSYQQLYVGPYVTCKQRTVLRDEVIRTCLNPTCTLHRKRPHQRNAHGDDRFCARCGHEVGSFTIQEKSPISPYEVVDDDLNHINPDEYNGGVLHLGANTRETPRDFTPEPDGTHLDITGIDIQAEIAWFEKMYAVDIEKLREVFDDVRVCWGVHAYTH